MTASHPGTSTFSDVLEQPRALSACDLGTLNDGMPV
jgi:hypothetical protein